MVLSAQKRYKKNQMANETVSGVNGMASILTKDFLSSALKLFGDMPESTEFEIKSIVYVLLLVIGTVLLCWTGCNIRRTFSKRKLEMMMNEKDD